MAKNRNVKSFILYNLNIEKIDFNEVNRKIYGKYRHIFGQELKTSIIKECLRIH